MLRSKIILVGRKSNLPQQPAISNPKNSEKERGEDIYPPLGGNNIYPTPSFPETVPELKNKILSLPKKEMKSLSDWLLLQVKESALPDKTDRCQIIWADAIYRSLEKEVGVSGRIAPVPKIVEVMQSTGAYGNLNSFLEYVRCHNLTVIEFTRFAAQVVPILVSYCRKLAGKVEVPLSAKFIAQQMQHLPGIFDNAFPGYARSGMVRMMIREKLHIEADEDAD